MTVPLTAACIAVAAGVFQVPEPALWTILKAEGGRVGVCTTQANGSHDCGPAQVNAETWAPRLGALLHRGNGEIAAELRDDGCFNVWAAAYVLRIKLNEANGDAWDAAGRYNSATPERKLAYQSRLIGAYAALFGPR
ncbi:MAG: lytic transglycosylase domain-containing protein [Acidisphaera sp.]|nr:lytic transglycosylase domain-containing protein [Acidisphaera sp.]